MNCRRLLKFACIGITSLGMVICIPATLQAQDTAQSSPGAQGTQSPEGHHKRGHHRANPEHQLKHLTKKLTLTSDQQQQILPILQQQDEQMQKLKSDTSVTSQDRRQQMRSIMTDTHQKIEAQLTDTQKQKFEQMTQKRRMHHQHMQQNGNSPSSNGENPPPSPQQ